MSQTETKQVAARDLQIGMTYRYEEAWSTSGIKDGGWQTIRNAWDLEDVKSMYDGLTVEVR